MSGREESTSETCALLWAVMRQSNASIDEPLRDTCAGKVYHEHEHSAERGEEAMLTSIPEDCS